MGLLRLVHFRKRAIVGVLATSCLWALLLWLPALAQDTDKVIRDASLQLWPEYDDPGLLVIFSGEFTGTTAFPQQVAFPVPAGARGIQATAKDPQSNLLNQPWEIVDGKLTYTLPQPGFHTEYYVDKPPSGNQRELSYTFEVPYKTQGLEVTVQQPARATDFSVTPQPESSYVGADGFTYYVIKETNLAPGDKLDFTIRYTKADQGFSRAKQAAADSPPGGLLSAPPAARSATSWLPWLLIGIGAAALAGVGVYWFTRQRATATARAPARAARASKPASQQDAAVRQAEGTAYCTQCGRQLHPDDRFCANCGAPRWS